MYTRSTPAPATVDAGNWARTRVVVLNATFQALTEVPAERAVTLLAIGAAESVEDREPAVPIRSQYRAIPLPLTIRLLEYVYLPRRPVVTDRSRATIDEAQQRIWRRLAAI
ncbi:hypothetical protein [Rhodococcus sp. NPDC059234]|uniref:hypothetical protein n=1 Tax=Rhodococcus sp. NPDC059234 TaxID=3346781 RepID=UPI00366AA745